MKLKELIGVYNESPTGLGNRSIRIYPNPNGEEYLDISLKKGSDGKIILSSILGYQILDRNVTGIRVPDFNMLAVYLGTAEPDQEEEPENVENPSVEPEPDTEIEEQPVDVEAEESEVGDNENEGNKEGAPEAEDDETGEE